MVCERPNDMRAHHGSTNILEIRSRCRRTGDSGRLCYPGDLPARRGAGITPCPACRSRQFRSGLEQRLHRPQRRTVRVCHAVRPRHHALPPSRQTRKSAGGGRCALVETEGGRGPKAVFEKFGGYAPRQEPPSWLAGGKRILLDRVKWIVIPDWGTAAAALQNGEVDWWELPIPDLIPMLRRNPNGTVAGFRPRGHARGI